MCECAATRCSRGALLTCSIRMVLLVDVIVCVCVYGVWIKKKKFPACCRRRVFLKAILLDSDRQRTYCCTILMLHATIYHIDKYYIHHGMSNKNIFIIITRSFSWSPKYSEWSSLHQCQRYQPLQSKPSFWHWHQ